MRITMQKSDLSYLLRFSRKIAFSIPFYSQAQNNGFMHQHEFQLVLNIHRNQKSALTLFDHKPSNFQLKISTKNGPIPESVKLAKIGNYDVINDENGITVEESEAYAITWSARFYSLENLLLDIDISAKSGQVTYF